MATVVSGKITEVFFARFDPGEDLHRGLLKVIKDKGIRSGLVMSIVGSLDEARLHHFTEVGNPSAPAEIIKMPGPLEISGQGLIGLVEAPAFGKVAIGLGHYLVHGEPFIHVHITATSHRETLCGHLLDGSIIRSVDSVSHFTVAIGQVEGAMLKCVVEPGLEGKPDSYRLRHELAQF